MVQSKFEWKNIRRFSRNEIRFMGSIGFDCKKTEINSQADFFRKSINNGKQINGENTFAMAA